MDLFSELQQAENDSFDGEKKHTGFDYSRGMYQTFAKSLTECCAPVSLPDRLHHTVEYEEKYCFTAIPPNTSTPFTNAVGLSSRKTVIISRLADQSVQNGSETPKEEAEFECNGEALIQNVSSCFTVNEYPSISNRTTSVRQKAMYITKDDPFPSNSNTSLFLKDLGATPTTCDEARHFCSLYALCCHENDNLIDLPGIWILCKGNRLLSMGCSVSNDNKTLDMYQIVDGGDIVIPSAQTYTVSLDSEPFSSRIGLDPVISYKQRHKVATAQYSFCPTEANEILLEGGVSGVRISMDFIWSGKDVQFSPPPSVAEAVVGVSVAPGYLMSPVFNIYSEVNTLLGLCRIAIGKDTWGATKYGEEDDEEVLLKSNESILLSRVNKFLEDASALLLKPIDITMASPMIELSPFQPREDMDFLGQLWMFVKHVTNLEDLVRTLGVVFKSVILGKVQPFIHQSKSSTLANLFRRSLSTNSIDEREVVATKLQQLFTEDKTLHCIVEIGLEKLQRDFIAYFGLGELATMNDLEPFFQSTDLLQCCHNLCYLHYVLELTSVLTTFLSLPLPSLSFFVRDTLKYYRTATEFTDFSMSPLFHVHFPSMSQENRTLINLASSLKPVSWSATITPADSASSLLRGRRRMFCLEEPLLKYIERPMSLTEKEEDDTDKLYLYHVKHHSTDL